MVRLVSGEDRDGRFDLADSRFAAGTVARSGLERCGATQRSATAVLRAPMIDRASRTPGWRRHRRVPKQCSSANLESHAENTHPDRRARVFLPT